MASAEGGWRPFLFAASPIQGVPVLPSVLWPREDRGTGELMQVDLGIPSVR